MTDSSVIFDERHLESLVKKMEKLRLEIDLLKDIANRTESDFQSIQREYFKVEKAIKEQNLA